MTIILGVLFPLFLLIALVALRHWALHDGFSTRSRPAWFD